MTSNDELGIIRTPRVEHGGIRYGGELPPLFLVGPDSLESEALVLEIGEALAALAARRHVCVVFKGSYAKANRSSARSYRGPGLDEGLRLLELVRSRTGLPVTSDVHDAPQARAAGEVLDMLQIPAYLCRQNDLLEAAAGTGRFVNVKKGQFLSPDQTPARVEAARGAETPGVLVTERGTFFGYGDLVNDMRALPRLRAADIHVVYDVTHSIQRPGALGDRSGGEAELVPFMARAAAGAGCDGFFLEVHPRPDEALCDGPSSLRLDRLDAVVAQVLAVDAVARGLGG